MADDPLEDFEVAGWDTQRVLRQFADNYEYQHPHAIVVGWIRRAADELDALKAFRRSAKE